MILVPSTDYRYVLKRGMSGTDVAALQLNLPGLAPDGAFGKFTEDAVIAFQKQHAMTPVDGIAGLATKQVICVTNSTSAARAHDLPVGLLKSILANESGFDTAAYSPHPSDEGFDLGAYQDSIVGSEIGSQSAYKRAYTVSVMAEATALKVATQHEHYANPLPVTSWYLTNIAGGDKQRFAWQLAILYHNWPVAAEGIWKRGSIFIDGSRDTQAADWVIEASAGRLRTPREWVVAYIQRSTVFVKW